jgi:hypothetical protein
VSESGEKHRPAGRTDEELLALVHRRAGHIRRRRRIGTVSAVLLVVVASVAGLGVLLTSTTTTAHRVASPPPTIAVLVPSEPGAATSRVPQPPAPRPTSRAAPPLGGPSSTTIRDVMATIHGRSSPSSYFAPSGTAESISDGAGGVLTAAVGVRTPSSDGSGCLVFFWHSTTFVGVNSTHESAACIAGADLPGQLVVSYFYGAIDRCRSTLGPTPGCEPPVVVVYRWNAARLTASGLPPAYGSEVVVQEPTRTQP